MKNNIIIGEINITSNDINKDIQIINSFENYKRIEKLQDKINDYKYENEKEIKEKIEIKINGKKINFSYLYRFNKEGKYKIEYLFKENMRKTNCMFYYCKSLTNLDLSNFKTQNVNDTYGMFCCCTSLRNIILSNFNTQNVTDMYGMFSYCESLRNLDLSNFNTQNVIDMSYMFFKCKSLRNLNLSNFNTQNVINMKNMFSFCESLEEKNIITIDYKILNNFFHI